MNTFFDVRTPFMKPLWRRVAFAGFTLIWGGVEFFAGNALFGMLFLVAGAYLVHQFFIAFKPDEWNGPDGADGADGAKSSQEAAPSAAQQKSETDAPDQDA